MFLFSLQIFSKIFLILRVIELDIIMNICIFTYKSANYYCHISIKPEFSRQVFEKYSNAIFHENHSSGAEIFHADEQTDRQTDVIQNLSASGNFTKAFKIGISQRLTSPLNLECEASEGHYGVKV